MRLDCWVVFADYNHLQQALKHNKITGERGGELDILESIKAWLLGAIIAPVITLLFWYFKRSTAQTDKRLEDLDASLDEVREMLSRKADRTEVTRVWERIQLQDQDIKNLGAAFSRELREQIDTLRRESNEHQRQTNDRLDRILTLVAASRSSDNAH